MRCILVSHFLDVRPIEAENLRAGISQQDGLLVRGRGGEGKVTKRLDIPRDLLERLYYDEGLSRQKIADRLGCTEWVVRSQMQQYGLPARRPWDYRSIDIS